MQRAFEHLNEMGLDRIYTLELPDSIPPLVLEHPLIKAGIEYLEPVPEYKLFYTPNDYSRARQWNLNKINAVSAWDIERGGKGIVIGLVDDGLDTAHPDLQPAVWHNTNEIPGNGLDDDGNGYTDDYFGWDVADNDNNPHVVPSDGLNHGTHCGGIAGAETDNNQGIASIGFKVKIMAIKTGRKGQLYLFNPYKGVEYAIVNKANIISMSWGGGAFSYTYQTLFHLAYSRNIICIAAAGNSGDTAKKFPAAYERVIAVGATDSFDRKSSFSCWGSWVDVSAPGTSVYSSVTGNAYAVYSGTSMACPMVSGLCALMLSRSPGMSNAQIESCLKASCDNINAINPKYAGLMGAGRINAYAALMCAKPYLAAFNSSKTSVCTGDTVRFYDKSNPPSVSRIWSFPGGSPSSSTALNPIIRYNASGKYPVTLISNFGGNSDTALITDYITVGTPQLRLSGNQTIFKGETGTIRADLTGTPPWTITIRNGNVYDTIRNILNSPYYILKTPAASSVYKPVSVQSGNCVGSVLDSAHIVLNQNITSTCDSALRFYLKFGGNGDDQGLNMAIGSDSNFYICGLTTSRGAGGTDAFITKINSKGVIVWYKTFGNAYNDQFSGITLDDSENIYVTGNSFPSGFSSDKMMLIVKLDKNGNTIWYKQLSGNSIEYMKSCVVSKKKKGILYFSGPCVSNSFGGEDFFLMKCDTGGRVFWEKKYGTTNTDRLNELFEDESGNLLMSGSMNYNVSSECLVIKTDSGGNVLYGKTYAGPSGYHDGIMGSAQIGNHYYFAGYTGLFSGSWSNRVLIVFKTDNNGQIIWSKKYYPSGSDQMSANTIPQLRAKNNRLYLAWSITSGGNDGALMYLDTSGNILKSSKIGDAAGQHLFAMDVCSDASVVYAGMETGSNNEVLLGKTNCKMESLCKTGSLSISVSNQSLDTQTPGLQSGTNNLGEYTGIQSNSYNLNPQIACIRIPGIIKTDCKLHADFTAEALCAGDSVRFNDQSSDTGSVITNRIWETGDGSTYSGLTSFRHVYKSTGTYAARLICKSFNGLTSCADTAYRTIRINDSLKLMNLPSDSSICLGDSIKIKTVLSACGTEPYRYSWSPSAGVSDTTAPDPFLFPDTSTLYTLTVSDAGGKQLSRSFRIIVNTACCKSIARIALSPEYACPGDTVQFINVSGSRGGSPVYTWIIQNGSNISYIAKNPPPQKFKAPGLYRIQLLLEDLCGRDTDVLDFPVMLQPLAYAGRDTAVCKNSYISLGTEGFDRNSYRWEPASGLDRADLPEPTARLDTGIRYVVYVQNEFGCYNTDTVFLSLFKGRTEITDDTLLCTGDSLFLSIPGNGPFLWNNGNTGKHLAITKPGIYWGKTNLACTEADTFEVKHSDCQCAYWIPNVFSPNADGHNDVFRVISECRLLNYSLKIFTRWGEQIFESTDQNAGWNGFYGGSAVQDGLYLYMIEFKKDLPGAVSYVYENGMLSLIR